MHCAGPPQEIHQQYATQIPNYELTFSWVSGYPQVW